MDNHALLEAAMRQSALEVGCRASDFFRAEPLVTSAPVHPKARRYLELPFLCNLVSYGSGVVAALRPDLREQLEAPLRSYLAACPSGHCFETPGIYRLNELLRPVQARVYFMAEYFLPDLELFRPLPCRYEVRLLSPEDFAGLYQPEWANALCAQRKELDRLAAGAFDNGQLVGLAGCSADCDTMWQIGVDVLPQYRRQGIAQAVTTRLAQAVLNTGKIPFYCAAWANLPSVRNAIRSGFRPAWTELTAKPLSFGAGETI